MQMELRHLSMTATPAHTRRGRPADRWTAITLSLMGLMAMSPGRAVSPPPAAVSAPATAVSPMLVSIKDFAFSPQTLTVAPGTTVTWKNLDDEPHTVRGADAQIRSDALDQDETYSVKFEKPGIYKYGCSIHPKMSGTIVVK
jgi:plastocyanin